ncbi:MAG TPA: CDP-alcohol phosphatidyltransferase family protein, partial [Candidatus Nanopelagicales bacterium]|nr:CDP-alcohol phosphatidyltransferase family protein [Candidatus Nanopelagicales bacterium]
GDVVCMSQHDRIVTIPNALSLARLVGIPVFLWLVLVEQADIWAFVVLVIAGASDWFDGYLARRLDQQSRLGELLDPLVDRLYILATIVGLALRDVIGWWLVALLIGRDVLLVVLLPLLRRSGRIALPVTFVGKAGTFALLWGFPLLLLGTIPGTWGAVLTAFGWAFALWGTFLYWWAGLGYARQMITTPRSTQVG